MILVINCFQTRVGSSLFCLFEVCGSDPCNWDFPACQTRVWLRYGQVLSKAIVSMSIDSLTHHSTHLPSLTCFASPHHFGVSKILDFGGCAVLPFNYEMLERPRTRHAIKEALRVRELLASNTEEVAGTG